MKHTQKSVRALVAALITFGSLAGVAKSASLIANPSFETGALSPWYQANGTPVITSTEAHTGSFSVAATGSDSVRQDFTSTATIDISEVSFWAKRTGGVVSFVQFFYADGSVGNTSALSVDNNWTFFDVAAFLDAGKFLTGFSVYGTSPGPGYFDDFAIEASVVPEPTATLLLGFGTLICVARRHKR